MGKVTTKEDCHGRYISFGNMLKFSLLWVILYKTDDWKYFRWKYTDVQFSESYIEFCNRINVLVFSILVRTAKLLVTFWNSSLFATRLPQIPHALNIHRDNCHSWHGLCSRKTFYSKEEHFFPYIFCSFWKKYFYISIKRSLLYIKN